jgi:hypothetical protein
MNNSKLVLFVICLFVLMFTAPLVTAAPRGGGSSGHFGGMAGRPGMWGGQRFSGGNWRGNNWHGGNWSGRNWRGGNWHNGNFHNRNFHNDNDVIFIGSFGFPWWWGWGWGAGWGWGYPYYGYPYGYGYYGYGDPYGYGYGYGYGGNQYGGDYGYGNGYGQYGEATHSRVAELQRRLARAGYYHGSVDGVLGPQTRRAIRAYERDHGYANR